MNTRKRTKISPAPVVDSLPVDPTKPFAEITVDGKVYRMCFTYRALAEAEDALNRKGYAVNALAGMIHRNYSTVRVLFALSLFAYHPETDFEAAQDWVTPFNIADVLLAMEQAWKLNSTEAKPGDPQKPDQ